MAQYTLFYFNIRGAGESIRLLLNYVNQPFEDIRIDFHKEWANRKSEFFFGKLPVLEIDGKKRLAQSAAILRYFGEKHGLVGTNEWERAKVDELIDFLKDIYTIWGIYFEVKKRIRKGNEEHLYKEFVENSETNFPLLIKLLEKSGSGFLIASGLTIVDFLVADYFYTMKKEEPEVVENKFPELHEYVDRVYGLPELREYIAKRKDTNY